jgi:plasmid replication initiation protein
MDIKKNTQMALPFDFENKTIGKFARQHWNITFGKQKKVGVMTKKLMAAVLSQINIKDKEFKLHYVFHITEFVVPGQNETTVYKDIKKSFDELTDLKWFFEDFENKKFVHRHLINTSDAKLGYANGIITIALNPILKPYFLELAKYTTYELKWYMTFSSWYSMRLFEILSAYKDTGFWIISINEYRSIMDCEDKYVGDNSKLIKKTISEPLIELESSSMAFTVEEIKNKEKGEKGRKAITHLKFVLKKVQLTKIPDVEIPLSTQKIIDKLKNRYLVSEVNIVKYLKAIGTKDTRKLLASWDLKEASSDPIRNKLHYCNKSFVDMGKKALE